MPNRFHITSLHGALDAVKAIPNDHTFMWVFDPDMNGDGKVCTTTKIARDTDRLEFTFNRGGYKAFVRLVNAALPHIRWGGVFDSSNKQAHQSIESFVARNNKTSI